MNIYDFKYIDQFFGSKDLIKFIEQTEPVSMSISSHYKDEGVSLMTWILEA
jgi:hypothetical protein